LIEWPGRCVECGREIGDWSEAGLLDKRWLHKTCWSERFREVQARGRELPPLRSPVERSSVLELPMLVFLLMYHFGLGAAVAGWVMLTQGSHHYSVPKLAFFTSDPDTFATVLLLFGIVVPLIGITGVAANILSRRRIEVIRQELYLHGGWKPGR